MKKYVVIAAVLLAAAVLVQAASAADPASVARDLPRSFSGTFLWKDRVVPQAVTLRLSVVAVENGLVVAQGKARHTEEYYRTDVAVEMAVDPATLAVEIWEKAPSGSRDNPKFTIDGSYRGTLAPDLRSISAVWTTAATGRKGQLSLKAD